MSRLGLVAALAATSMMGMGVEARPAAAPKRTEIPRPPREERKRRRRLPFRGRPEKIEARPYVAHERAPDGKSALCRANSPYWELGESQGTHRLAKRGEPIMCNDCQRTRWRLDQEARRK